MSESDCILWTGSKDSGGYGHRWIGGRLVKAHRHAWASTHGPIPAGMHVCHKCDVRSCINPDHLFLGTNADNMEDKRRKGRAHGMNGETNGNAKLTQEAVNVIRSGGRVKDLAARFNVCRSTIQNVRAGIAWRVSPSDEQQREAAR